MHEKMKLISEKISSHVKSFQLEAQLLMHHIRRMGIHDEITRRQIETNRKNPFHAGYRMEELLFERIHLPKLRSMRVTAILEKAFDRRVTCVEFPTDGSLLPSETLAIASKSGDIQIWNLKENIKLHHFFGKGAGGCINSFKFCPWNSDFMHSASVDGTVKSYTLSESFTKELISTNDLNHWYTSLDSHKCGKRILLSGDNKGTAVLLDSDGKLISKHAKIHKNKISFLEFHPTDEHMLCTGSNDHYCKFWDLRNMSVPVFQMKHEAVINSCCFSPSIGSKLLTTTQNDEIRIYDTGRGTLESVTPIILDHPHRPFQHLTHFQAFWHPLSAENSFTIGRFDESRGVDLYVKSKDTGSYVVDSNLNSPKIKGLYSVR